ncbi:(Fe-S)-binding protein [Streptomyces sp. 7N604]|uniref:(Fe-S)-binding protein n=1 Tax=Streptomyces sp. 7N604 TaxID=3457415 RepID=UPI003FD47B61
MRIALFISCLDDTLAPATGRAVVSLLERLGCEVEFPQAQTCCGQMHFNTGYVRECVPLVRRFAGAFAGYDAVVTPSGSCAAMVREYHGRVAGAADDDGRLSAAVSAAPKVYELSEFLVDVLGVTDVGAHFPHRVTYHPTCHGLRALGIGDRPLALLRAVRGIDLVELPAAEQCCGFGGTFALKNADTSVAMCADKVRHALDTGAEVLCAGDNSCLVHIGGMLSRLRTGVRTVHLAEILASTESTASTSSAASSESVQVVGRTGPPRPAQCGAEGVKSA